MAKKVLILSSSPRRGGNSDTLCDEFMRGAAESNHEVEKIFLRDKTIHYCTGCSTCSLYQKPCPQKDDAAEIIEKMVDADVIVMATPVYFYTISAQMKTLIDRCCIIRKTKCFDFWERNVLFPKTKRSFFRTPTPLPCPFPLNFSLLIITKKFGNLAKNRYICIV